MEVWLRPEKLNLNRPKTGVQKSVFPVVQLKPPFDACEALFHIVCQDIESTSSSYSASEAHPTWSSQ